MAEERGPTITSDLYSAATDELRETVRAQAHNAAESFVGWANEQIKVAYSRGLQDGFAQGVHNACKLCGGSGYTFRCGSPDNDTMTADLMHCSVCGDGKKVCGTDRPCVTIGEAEDRG